MVTESIDIVSSNKSIAEFMGFEYKDKPFFAWYVDGVKLGVAEDFLFHSSWDWLMPVIDKINGMGKEYQFAIFKTYCSCTVEKGGKVYKDFSFAHSEVKEKGKEIEASYKLVVKFITWYNAQLH